MPQHTSPTRDDNDDAEIRRVSQDIAGRLHLRGVEVRDDESPEDIVSMLEAVEAFERAVEAKGGDLMVDEPPARGDVQPDNADFLLPTRADDESASAYIERLSAATQAVKAHPRD